MFYEKYLNKNPLTKYYIILLIISIGFVFRIYNLTKLGYWMDEWNAVYWSNPIFNYKESSEIFFYGEFAPPLYQHLLKYFFYFFGYTAENGKLFSIILGTLSILLAIIISRQINKNNLFLYTGILVALNIFLIWQSQEVRLASLALFLCLLNIILFLKIYFNSLNKYSFLYQFLYVMITILLLSAIPISLSVVAGQIAFIIHNYFLKKNNKIYLLFPILISCFIYLLLNFKYFTASVQIEEFHANFEWSFFVNYHFRTFFGSILLGAIHLLIIFFLLINFFKHLLNDERLILITYIIFFTYFLTIVYTFLKAPLMAPRYVIWLVPLIIIWIVHVAEKSKNKKFFNIFIISLICVSLVNTVIKLPKNPISKVPMHKVLHLISESDTQSIITPNKSRPFSIRYINGNEMEWSWSIKNEKFIYDIFENYISINKKFIKNNMKMFNKNNVANFSKAFWFICLNKPRYRHGIKKSLEIKDDDACINNEEGQNWKLIKTIQIEDFILKKYNVVN